MRIVNLDCSLTASDRNIAVVPTPIVARSVDVASTSLALTMAKQTAD